MKRFRFRLETVLRARRLLAEIARRNLGAAADVRRRCERSVGALRDELHEAVESLAVLQAGEIDATPVLASAKAIERLGELIERAAQRMAEATAEEDAKRVELAEARRDMRVVEDLREKARRDYVAECAREEMAEIEDMGRRRARGPIGAVRIDVARPTTETEPTTRPTRRRFDPDPTGGES